MSHRSRRFFDRSFDKGRLKDLLRWTFENYGAPAAVDLAERLKNLGFRSAAAAGISLGVEDLRIPKEKRLATRRAERTVRFTEATTARAASTIAERSQARVEAWARASEARKTAIVDTFRSEDPLSPLYLRAFSGARGNRTQVRQLIGRRGLRVDPLGRLVEFPIRSNFKEGRTLTEFLISCYGARKGIVDTALRTATAGYLTRRLVDVAHYQVIGRLDCGTRRAIRPTPLFSLEGRVLAPVSERRIGRALARPVEGIGPRNTFLTPELAERREKLGITPWIRSPLACRAGVLGPRPERFQRQRYLSADIREPAPRLRGFSLCQRCYGWSLADAGLVHLGEAVGVLAAQSIGEPGTQLTRRTFHTGGVFSGAGAKVLRSSVQGWVHFSKPLRGRRARTRTGKIGYLTREEGELILQDMNGVELSRRSLPPFVLLLVREGQRVTEGLTLAERSTSKSIQEGELILRVARAPQGGQLSFLYLQQKQPLEIPRQQEEQQAWRGAERTQGLSRIRISSGEVITLPVRSGKSGSFSFRPGDRVAPLTHTSNIQVATPGRLVCQNGEFKEVLTVGTRGHRQFFKNQIYQFGLTTTRYSSRLLLNSWKGLYRRLRDGSGVVTPVIPGDNCIKTPLKSMELGWIPAQPLTFKNQRLSSIGYLPGLLWPAPSLTWFQQKEKDQISKSLLHTISLNPAGTLSSVPISKQLVATRDHLPLSFLPIARTVSRIRNKQSRNWYFANPKIALKQQGVFPFLERSLPARYSQSAPFVSLDTVWSNPRVERKGSIQRRKFTLDTTKLLADAQGFQVRAGAKAHRVGSKTFASFTHRTKDWGEFITSQNTSAFSQQQLFVGRSNVFALSLPAGVTASPLGTYCSPPVHITKGAGSPHSGILRSFSRGSALFRRTIDWNLAPDSLIRGMSGDLIPRHWPLTAIRGRAVETGDITSGIPRVDALLEARERSGITPFVRGLYQTFQNQKIAPRLAVRKSIHAAQRAILDNVQRIYRTNGVVLDDKHVELIVRPRGYGEVVRDSAWHEPLARGEIHPREVLERANQLRALYNLTKAEQVRDLYPRIEYEPVILGLTKASLWTTSESFLSAASFQETSRVLARAGIRGRTDYLLGLKENLILGTRLPIGTAARHLLLVPSSSLESRFVEPTRKETSPETRWEDRPTFTHDPSWLDALLYLGESLDSADLLSRLLLPFKPLYY